MTNSQILDAINQNIKRNENNEITGDILNSVLRMLLDFRNANSSGKVDTIDGIEADENKDVKLGAVRKSESNEVEAGFDLHQKDGASIGVDVNGVNVFKGGITATFGNSSISVDNFVPDAAYKFQEILFPKRAVKNVEEKVYPVTYVNGVKADDTGRVDISGIAWNYTNPSIRYSGIVDKSADATYNQLLGVDSNGYASKVNGKTVFINLPDILTESEKTAWKTKMNGGWTTQTMSVFSLSPLVFPKSDEFCFMVLSGANLNLNPVNFKIEIISAISQNVIAEIPNNQVNLISSSSLNFYYNFKDLAESEYKLKITNGLASYITPLAFYVKANIDYINLSTNTWETWKHNIDSVVVTETPQVLQTINTLQTSEYYGKVVNTKLSKVLFEANDNFVLTYTIIQGANTNANPNLKIGITDLSDVNNLDNNIIQVITRFSGPQIQNSINGAIVNSISNSPTTVTIIKDKNKLTQIISTSTAISTASTIVNILSPIRLKVLFHGVSESDATSKVQIQSCYKF